MWMWNFLCNFYCSFYAAAVAAADGGGGAVVFLLRDVSRLLHCTGNSVESVFWLGLTPTTPKVTATVKFPFILCGL